MISLTEYVERAVIPNIKSTNQHKSIIYANYEKNTANIFKKINAFIIKYEDEKYFFEGPLIEIKLKTHQESGWIEKPKIGGEKYNHPFVRGNNSICFSDGNEDENWKRAKVTFEAISPYQTLDFARMIERAFVHTASVLTQGYFENPLLNKFVHPVTILCPENFKLERKKGELFGR